MANRYWVGGAGNWSSTTKWATSSGGASGASVPISTDDVIFDANSGGKFTATVDTAQSVNSITITPSATVGVQQIALTARLTTNNLTTTGTAGNNRIWFRATTYGISIDFVVNGTVSISDCDFLNIYVTGTAAPISGTRIGNLAGCSGITFNAPKTVYWNLAGAQNWSATGWATTSTGTPSDNNFPLAQDTATFTNAGSVTGTITMNSAIPYTGTVDMSGRTSAMTLATTAFTIYGDWKNGSGTTLSGTAVLTYSGSNTQTITSAGRPFSQAVTIDSYGGTVQLADAFDNALRAFVVTNGTFDTKNYNLSVGSFQSSSTNVRAITFGSSTVTLINGSFTLSSTNLTFNAGTSQITCNVSTAITFTGDGQTFYNVTFSSSAGPSVTHTVSGANTFNNFTPIGVSGAGLMQCAFSANQTINGTLTCAGSAANSRGFLRSGTVGTVRTLTVGTLVATDCDFRDITIAGAAAGSSPTRAGDCGGNTGITFPAAKTVYWNLAGTQNWSATGWATSSGGTPAANNFPLAQDTAVFDNTGSVTGTITVNSSFNIGTFNASARTSAMSFSIGADLPRIHGDWLFGTGVSAVGTAGTTVFSKRGTQTITSNGVTFAGYISVDAATGTVQLADALSLSSTRSFTLDSGTFDAVSYNVTVGAFFDTSFTSTIKMGSGTWTLSGTDTVFGSVWSTTTLNFYKGTANIVLSSSSSANRSFTGNSQSYNKLTIGGATGISTLTIFGANQFTELASTKTVAHNIIIASPTTFGAWTVTGTVGNVVTLSGFGSIIIAGARVSGVDYLALGTIAISPSSPGEFYAGANSTGTGTGVILTAAPAAVTRYWVGGTGTWDATTTTNWSATSGGAGGVSVPTSADAVIFDTLSNATAYTVTCTATQLRCAALTMAGPALGNVTWAGSASLAIHGNTSLAATGITRSYSGNITLTGSSTGRTLTTNGVTLGSAITVNGVSCGWTLGSALDNGFSEINITNGSFDTGSYSLSTGTLSSNNLNSRTINLNTSTVSCNIQFNLGSTNNSRANLTFNAGTSQINFNLLYIQLFGNNQTFYNVASTYTSVYGPSSIRGENTFNNLTLGKTTATNFDSIEILNNQTINGTLTLSAGTDATRRTFLRSDTIGTTRTLTCAAFSGTDVDFRDITIAGAAAPVSGTRLGDCKGNSGITFGAGVTRYWNLAAGGNWSATGWAATSGGAPAANNFPLAQDTALFESTGLNSGSTITLNNNWNIGTIDMSARTGNTMTLATGGITPSIYGNWINGTGTTLTGTALITFAGRGSQTITSAGKAFTQYFLIDSPGGSVTLQDSLNISNTVNQCLLINRGTFNAATYNVTLAGTFSSSNAFTRTVAIGSGTWTITGTTTINWSTLTTTNLTVTGTGTISLTSASAKTFEGGTFSYSGITLDQGGAGTLTITGNNTFKNITNTYSATGATTIDIGATTQTVTQFTGTGTSGKVLTVQGTSASSPGTLILTTGNVSTPNYLAITNVRAYPMPSVWYAGANSTNNGSLGWVFTTVPLGALLAGVLAAGSVGTMIASVPIALALTGVSATGSRGTITASQTLTRALTGVSATGSRGTITASQTLTRALTGVSATGSRGTITASQALTRALTGVSATGSLGTVTTSQTFTAALTGNLAAGSVGTVIALKDAALTGVFASGGVGTVVASQEFLQALTGVFATGGVGTISIQPPALTGVFASGGVGTVVASQAVSFAVTGVAATGSLGTITTAQALTRTLTGNLAIGSLGVITTSQAYTRALTGNSASGAVGTVSYGRAYALSGSLARGAVGTVVNSQALTRVLTGVSASGIVGTIIPVSWQLINDAQNADWQLVNNAQTATWQLINTPT